MFSMYRSHCIAQHEYNIQSHECHLHVRLYEPIRRKSCKLGVLVEVPLEEIKIDERRKVIDQNSKPLFVLRILANIWSGCLRGRMIHSTESIETHSTSNFNILNN